MSNPLLEIVKTVSPYDSADLVATAGALQLLPENAAHIVRLDALAHAAASLDPATRTVKISSPRLRALLNNTLDQSLGHAEDPPPDCVVEEIPFFGGSYKVFPGAGESLAFIVRNLISAIFFSPHINQKEFLEASYGAAAALLLVSNEVASRAGLRRGTEPISADPDIVVPSAEALQQLKSFVTFTEGELQALLARRKVGLNSLGPFVADGGADHAGSYTVELGTLHDQPIVRLGKTFIAACPGSLLDALAHRLNCLAVQHALTTEYSVAYNHAIRASVSESFRYLGIDLIQAPPTQLKLPPTVTELVAEPDADKVIHALVVTDTLDGYDVDGKSRHWDMEPLTSCLVDRMKELEQQVHAADPAKRILFLIVHQATGRAYGCGFDEFSEKSLFQMVSAADLRTIALLDAGNPLALWNFAEAAEGLRKKEVLLRAWNTLDKYGIFRKHEYSFCVSDDRLPNLIAIQPADFSRPLRCEVAHHLDVHAVPHYQVNGTIEVRSLHGNPEIPIYVPVGPRKGRTELFVGALDVPTWIIGPEQVENEALYEDLADAVAFWLWQARAHLRGNLTADKLLTIEVLVSHEGSRKDSSQDQPLPAVVIEKPSASAVRVVFTPKFPELVRYPDNRADRDLLKNLLLGLTNLKTDSKGEEKINAVLDQVAPVGLKKKLLSFNPGADPALDGRGLPAYRGVQKYQIGKLLDSVGEHLAAIKIPVGPIADGDRTKVLNDIVGFCYKRMQEVTASLSPEGVLEYVIARHEAILHKEALGKATIATRLACFDNDQQLITSFQEGLQTEARDALSIRFLIEYLAAVPPSGDLPMTLERFDEMLMLASEVINFGMLSDLVRNELADLKLSVVPSERLGIKEDQYRRARNQYVAAFTGHEIYASPKTFRRLTDVIEQDESPPDLVGDLDAAALAEFGYSMGDLSRFVGELLRLSDPSLPFQRAKRVEIHASMRAEAGWTDLQTTKLVDSLLLRQRPDFLQPEQRFAPVEVYPWRFNRSLSYLRRPLIQRPHSDGEEIVWGSRHIYHAHDNLLKLCLSGRLRATTPQMKKFISSVTNRQGEHFNDQVAGLFAYPELEVKKRVSKVPKTTGLKNIGDIDVLAADAKRKRLEVVECKDLSNARTPHELKLEIENLVGSERAANPIVRRHGERLKWVKQNLQSVLEWMGFGNAKGWKVDGYIVVDHPLMAPYFKKMPLRVISFSELESELKKQYEKPGKSGF